MDHTQILHTLQNNISTEIRYLIPLFLVVAAGAKSPWFNGRAGEALVNLSARLLLYKTRYHLIKNVTLPTEGGKTQVDHIIVSPYGVFVVETKSMKGWVFGRAYQRHRTQKIYQYSLKFQNPLYQNYQHVRTLQALLRLSDAQIHSVVVFVGEATLKTKNSANVKRVVGICGLLNRFRSLESLTQDASGECEAHPDDR